MWAQLLLYTGSCVYHDCGIHWPTLSDMQMSQREIGTRVSVTMTLTGLYHSVASHTQCRYTFTASKQCSREFVGPYPFHLFFLTLTFSYADRQSGVTEKGRRLTILIFLQSLPCFAMPRASLLRFGLPVHEARRVCMDPSLCWVYVLWHG